MVTGTEAATKDDEVLHRGAPRRGTSTGPHATDHIRDRNNLSLSLSLPLTISLSLSGFAAASHVTSRLPPPITLVSFLLFRKKKWAPPSI